MISHFPIDRLVEAGRVLSLQRRKVISQSEADRDLRVLFGSDYRLSYLWRCLQESVFFSTYNVSLTPEAVMSELHRLEIRPKTAEVSGWRVYLN